MVLRRFDQLAPSPDADDDGAPRAPEAEPLPLTYLGRGKGILASMALAGAALFFLPWVRVVMPETLALSGFDLARRLGWSWGAGVAWFVLLPTILSRRTIQQMRGARVAAAFLAAVPAATVAILLAKPPRGGLVPIRFSFDWPLYATLGVSLAAAVFAAGRFGGAIDDIRTRRGSSRGQSLH